MVVADQGNWLADVVFVIEGTANLSPYIDSIKANYVVPTLEYFNGGPVDDRDCGCDYNSTMYALVVFMAADCAPETAATCSTPTTNIHKFLSLLDKIQFIGGAGESHSHIAEGLSTALQAFDDFQALRETNSVTQKHCILICNSPPYPIPALESSVYSLLMPEQLASVMSERQVSFSIFSPRKIPTLFKLYEKAGGDLQLALTKKYAKDRRHLVLLRGFQLQERPMSPPSIESKTAAATSATNSVCSPPTQGQKRPATNSPPNPRELTGFKQPNNYSGGGSGGGLDWPAENSVSQISLQSSMPGAGGPTQTLTYAQPGLPGQLNVRPGIPTPPGSHMGTLNQPNAPNITITNKAQPSQLSNQHMDNVRPQRGHSPVTVGPRMSWNQPAVPSPPASTPPTTSVLATQLSMAPSNVRHPQTVTLQSLSQSQTIIPSQILSSSGGSLRPNMSGVGLRMTTASSGSIPSVSSTSNNLASQLGQHSSFGPPSSQPSQQPSQLPTQGMASNMQSKLGSGPAMNPMISSQGPSLTSAPTSSNMPPQGMQSNIGSMSMNNNLSGPQSSSQSVPPQQAMKDRRSIWAGIIEFQEKSAPQQAQRVSHSLSCTFSCTVTNGEPEVNADKWPNRLALQLLPKQLVMNANLFAVLKTAARHVLIHFNQESDALQKLCKIMSTSWVGCIQFSAPCDIRIMLVVYMADKRIYMGFIAHDQDAFFNAVRAMYDNHRKQMQQQQQKQRLSGNPNPTSEGMGLPSSTTSNPGIIMSQQPAIANISGNNPMGPRMPLGQEQVSRNVSQLPPPPVPAPSSGIVHSTTMNQPQPQQQPQQQQQPPVNQQQQTNNARISQLEAARQQNLLKIQQLQQTLEAAQQKEVQFKIAQEQQQQQQQQHQQQQQQQVVIRQLQQQLQQQQQQLQQHQQRIQMQQVSQGSHNPQLRHLLQQQVQQQIRQQQHQMLMQHPQNIRAQLSNNMPSGQPPQSQQQSQPPQQSWGDAGLLDLLPP